MSSPIIIDDSTEKDGHTVVIALVYRPIPCSVTYTATNKANGQNVGAGSFFAQLPDNITALKAYVVQYRKNAELWEGYPDACKALAPIAMANALEKLITQLGG